MEAYYNLDIADIRQQEYPTLQGELRTSFPFALDVAEVDMRSRLTDITYLDHAGSTPVAKSLARRFSKDMMSDLFGNPHSASPSSERSTRRVESVRLRLLRFFRADPEHFDLVFTSNTTAAIKLVADAFRETESPGFWYGYHRDAHTSLVGVREYAAESRCFTSDDELELFLNNEFKPISDPSDQKIGLFAWPAQSNMNGRRLPLDLAGRVRSRLNFTDQSTYTLLDAAAYCTTGQLDLSDHHAAPDFTALSLHKIFGFPDLGALVIRKAAGQIFKKRRYFGGGTVDMVTVLTKEWYARKDDVLHEQLEDGTLPFHQIIALDSALNVHSECYGSMTNITKHTSGLAANMYRRLRALKHANGVAVCDVYKDPRTQYGNPKTQGPTVAFNIRNSRGGWIGKSDVERLAIIRGIHLRTGGVCNPGGIASFCSLDQWEMRRNFSEGMRCGDNLDIIGGKPTGIVRASLGAMSCQQDVDNLIDFVETFFVETTVDESPVPVNKELLAAESGSVVEALYVYPVQGCQGWKVPYYISWPIGERGLGWDNEWSFVSLDDGEPLDPQQHTRLQSIRPFLNVERGTLRLVGSRFMTDEEDHEGEDTEIEETIEIDLWTSPAETEQVVLDPTHLPADRYGSEAIANFCTSVVGVECTLARFRDRRKNRCFQDSCAAPLGERVIQIGQYDSGSGPGNVAISGSSDWQFCRFVQIGNQYFKHTDPSEAPDLTILRKLVHMRSKFDRSRTAQNPEIQAGDAVRTFTLLESLEDAELQACIASDFIDGHICPVWRCRRGFARADDLSSHLLDHANDIFERHKPKPAPLKAAEIQVVEMGIATPRLSRNPITSRPRPRPRQRSPSAFSLANRRKSWREKLSSIVSRPTGHAQAVKA